MKTGANLNEKDQVGGSSPLIIAATFGQTEVAIALIEAGVDINQKNNDGSTALHTAALFCHTDIVKALLDKGADKSVRNHSGATALELVDTTSDLGCFNQPRAVERGTPYWMARSRSPVVWISCRSR